MRCPHGARYVGKSDEQLMVEFYGCDSKAFDELWYCRRWRDKMSRYVARKVTDPNDIEDILQNTAIKVWETKHRPSARYNPHRGHLQSWLFRIVENVIRDRFRREHSEGEILLGDLQAESMEEGEEGEVPEPPEFAVEEDIEKRIIIQDAVGRLPEPSRTIVQRMFWDGLTIEKIAEELGMSEATVHRRLKQDLKRLEEMLS